MALIPVGSKKRCLLTGATGFVGANLTRHLLRLGHEVHVMVRSGARRWRLEDVVHNLTWHTVDLTDPDAVRTIVRDVQPDWVFHLAAHGAYSCQNNPVEIHRTNFLATTCLVTACLEGGCQCLVHAGSSSEYGFKDHAPKEDEAPEPNSSYALNKLFASLYCQMEARRNRMNIVTLRLYSVYGPYEDSGRLIPALIRAGLSGSWPVMADPRIARDFIHVDDVCRAFCCVATSASQKYGRIYNVGTGRQTNLLELSKIMADVTGVAGDPVWNSMEARNWDSHVWVSNPGLIRQELGWSAEIGLEQGLASTFQWYQKNSIYLNKEYSIQ